MARQGYRGISLPMKISDEIDKILEVRQYGYTSRADFIKDAVRRRLMELNNINSSSNSGCNKTTNPIQEVDGEENKIEGGD